MSSDMKQVAGTSIWGNDKITYVLYPKVYFDFCSALARDHTDLYSAMSLAQVNFKDGSAFNFLNTLLGTRVKLDTPMEIGFAQLLDALNMRSRNISSQAAIERVAKQFKNHANFPTRSDPSKPMFPDEANQ